MVKKLIKQWPWLVALLSLSLLLTACGRTATKEPAKTTGKIHFVTSLDFYGDPARAILGDAGTVTSLINSPSVDPHDYSPTTNDAKIVARADLALMNGAGYDSWLAKLVKADDEQTQLIDVAADIVKLPDGGNEHLWYDFSVMPQVTKLLVKRFSALRPAQAATFERNGQKYLARLAKLQEQEKELRQTLSGQKVMITEPVFNYVLTNLKMTIVNESFALDIEEGADPKPADIQRMQDQLDHREVSCLVVNKQVTSALVTDLIKRAERHQVPILRVTETLPQGKNYLSWMTGQLQAFAAITE